MNKKRILAIIMSLTLAFSVVGCGKSDNGGSSSTETTKEETASNSGSGFKKIELNQKNVFELGKKQTKEIKDILDKYGAKNAYNADKNVNVPIHIAKDENDCSLEKAKGYNISTAGETAKVNDGGDHEYTITYGAIIDKDNNDKPSYSYEISIQYPTSQEFKIDNFKMFKDLVTEVHGEDYDFASLESWMNDHMKKTRDGSKVGGSARDTGSYHEGVQGGDTKLGNKSKYFVTYIVTLRK